MIYGGDLPVEEKGLTIGGYKSTFFADLVAAYILENAEDVFSDSLYNKIYRDDGIDIKKTILTTDEVCEWLERFQSKVNQLTGSEYLQFTADVWDPDAPVELKPKNPKVTINRNQCFPYLDMELYWRDNELKYKVHLKENQLLTYLNQGSTHTNTMFKSIPYGVLRRLSNLRLLPL